MVCQRSASSDSKMLRVASVGASVDAVEHLGVEMIRTAIVVVAEDGVALAIRVRLDGDEVPFPLFARRWQTRVGTEERSAARGAHATVELQCPDASVGCLAGVDSCFGFGHVVFLLDQCGGR